MNKKDKELLEELVGGYVDQYTYLLEYIRDYSNRQLDILKDMDKRGILGPFIQLLEIKLNEQSQSGNQDSP